ncbi:MAG: hypothetical protein WCJ46_04400 [bacterium]
MSNIKFKETLNKRIVEMMKEFCDDKDIKINDFLEQAIVEKIEVEQIKDELFFQTDTAQGINDFGGWEIKKDKIN